MVGLVAGDLEEQLAGQRIAVGMQAGRGKADEHIAGLDLGAGDQLLFVNNADDEAGEVVFAVGIKARHLGGLSADQRAAVGLAGVGEAGDDLFDDALIEASGGEVIEKEERGRALDRDIVDAMIDQVCADSVVKAHFKGDLELGANAVGARNQHRRGISGCIEAKEAAEAADFAEHLFTKGPLCQVFDPLFGAVAAGDVDSGVGVGDRAGGCFWVFLRAAGSFRQGESVVAESGTRPHSREIDSPARLVRKHSV